jgi:hypothetical protein
MGDATDSAPKAGQPEPEEALQPEQAESAAEGTRQEVADDEAELQSAAAAALEKGKIFATSEGDSRAKLTDLLPELLRVRKVICQREKTYQKGRRNGAPNWGRWLKDFKVQTGVRLSDKTIKKELDILEGIKPVPRPKKPREATIRVTQARQMGLALISVHEMLEKVNEHGTVILKQEDVAILGRMLPSAKVLDRLVSSLPNETEDAPIGPASPEAAGDHALQASGSPNSQAEHYEVKAGDGAALRDAMVAKCWGILEAGLGGLSPASAAATLLPTLDEISKLYLKSDEERIAFQIRHIPTRPRGLSRQEFDEHSEHPSLFDESQPGSPMAT